MADEEKCQPSCQPNVPSHPPSQDALPGYEASPGHEASPNQDDPPPYSAVAGDGSLSLSCSVCGALISVKSESTQRIVKCGVCQEATPIKSPPAGKMFVRCSCNCLLICRASAQRVACPRPHCRRVIDLTGYGLSGTEWQYGGTRVSCGHCGQTFLGPPSTMKNQVRCPLCRKVSFIGREYPMRRCLYFIVVAIILAAFAGVLMGITWQRAVKYKAIYFVWTFILVLSVGSVCSAVYWALIKISKPLHN